MFLFPQVTKEFDLIALYALHGLVARIISRRLQVEASEGAHDSRRTAREIADQQWLRVKIAAEHPYRREQPGQRRPIKRRIAHDQTELLAHPLRAVDVIMPEAFEAGEPLVYVENTH